MTLVELQSLVENEEEESSRLELKEGLSSPDGRDAWYDNGRLGKTAKKAILKEVGAFANAQGGRVILGLKETSDNPPRASEICTIPRPEELRVALQDLFRTVFEPAAPRTEVSVVMVDDNEGVIVIDVEPSSWGPLRDSLTKQCWRRTDTSSHAMSMKEIQDSALSTWFRGTRIDEAFSNRSEAFQKSVRLYQKGFEGVAVGIRVTMVPLVDVNRYDFINENRNPVSFPFLQIGSEQFQHPNNSMNRRKILRGNRWEYRGNRFQNIAEAFQSGLIETHFIFRKSANERTCYVDWILCPYAYSVKEYLYQSRTGGAAQFIDYISEVEIYGTELDANWLSISELRTPCYKELDNPFLFPRYAFSSEEEAKSSIDQLCLDLYSICGRHESPNGDVQIIG